MAYSDEEYFQKNVKQEDLDLLLKDADGQEVTGRLEQAITEADDLIDGYLKGGGVTLPFAAGEVPPSIQRCSFSIALYYLHDWIQPDDIPTRIKEARDNSIEYLKGISRGEVTLTGTAQSASEETGIWSSSATSRFHRDMF